MAGLGGLLAFFLAIANKRLYVYEDPRISQVEELLPHSNCGACGTAGCRNFAEQVVEGKIEPACCTVNTPDQNKNIAALLGVAMGDVEKRVARLACAGGQHVAKMRAHYAGLSSCRAAAVAGGGGKSCAWGCLGLGDCADVCDFDAIHMDRHGLPVVDSAKCTACGDCVDICPKSLFSIQGVTRQTVDGLSQRSRRRCGRSRLRSGLYRLRSLRGRWCGRPDPSGTQSGRHRLRQERQCKPSRHRTLSHRRHRLARRRPHHQRQICQKNHPYRTITCHCGSIGGHHVEQTQATN